MIDVKEFREQGYLYDSLENYKELINFDEFVKIKEFIDSKNLNKFSKYDYLYFANQASYHE